jgi:3-hydroxy-9,10-secoandrosta-1,3,5(10)-triene-9,17-dione monooxygenase reductase component
LNERRLSHEQYGLLVTLLIRDQRSKEEAAALIRYSNVENLDYLITSLEVEGCVTKSGGAIGSTYALTQEGRSLIIELVAVAKAAEFDAERGLDFGETQMLKHLLRRVIRNTEEGDHRLWGSAGRAASLPAHSSRAGPLRTRS